MASTYEGALGTTVNVYPSGSSVSVGFDSTLVIIGDGTNGSAELGTPVFLPTQDDADEQFGSDSGIASAFAAAQANGAASIYGVAIDETATDPDWSGAAQAAMDLDPRYIYVDASEDSAVNAVTGVVNSRATDLEFARVFAPISSVTAATDISSYEPRSSDQRAIEVAPQKATVAGADTYTAAAVAGHASTQPLGASIAYDQLTVDSLGTEYRDSEAVDFEQVTAVTKSGEIVDGLTTSDEAAFEDIFQVEIVDTVALGLDQIAQDYAGTAVNTPDERRSLRADMRIYLASLASQSPPLLADAFGGDPYRIDVSVGGSEDAVNVDVGVNPVDVMKEITLNLNVGRIVEYGGAEA